MIETLRTIIGAIADVISGVFGALVSSVTGNNPTD